MGIALFETDVLREALERRPVDLTLEVLRPMVEAGERVFAHSFGGYWEDVGTLATYYRANLDLLRAEARLALDDPEWPILRYDERAPMWNSYHAPETPPPWKIGFTGISEYQ